MIPHLLLFPWSRDMSIKKDVIFERGLKEVSSLPLKTNIAPEECGLEVGRLT